jgi:hypothetical protein
LTAVVRAVQAERQEFLEEEAVLQAAFLVG